jgi:hypothetical protein
MKRHILLACAVIATSLPSIAADSEQGFVKIMDGTTFAGWKIGDEPAKAWTISDGAFVAKGSRSHLYYVGDEKPFKDFELKVDVMTERGSNGGIYFHTKYQPTGWPTNGFEVQVNVSHSDWKKTGSLYDVAMLGVTPAKDNEWWTQHIIVKAGIVTVKINDVLVLQYKEPPGVQPAVPFTRKLADGTVALQAHDPGSVVRYRNIRVKRI